ncbi:hypothetical protein JCM3770_003313 [Rhodotorula araucariae]
MQLRLPPGRCADGRKRVLHVVNGGICYSDGRKAASDRDARKYSDELRLRKRDMIANGQDYWWVFHELEYAAPAFQSADGKVEIHIAEHVAEPAMYNFIKQHMRTDDECIVIHAVDSDLLPLAVAYGAEYIVQKLQSGYNLYCMSALGEARMEAVWPFRDEAVNALAAVLIGNDYSRGLMGVGPKRLVTTMLLVDFARRDWALLNEAEPDKNALPRGAVRAPRGLMLEKVHKIASIMMG